MMYYAIKQQKSNTMQIVMGQDWMLFCEIGLMVDQNLYMPLVASRLQFDAVVWHKTACRKL